MSSSPFFLKSPRVRPCECGCIHEDALFPIPPDVIQLSSGWMEQLWLGMPGRFPRLKGRQKFNPFSMQIPCDYLVALIINRYPEYGIRLFLSYTG
jgi:hypothetical protein